MPRSYLIEPTAARKYVKDVLAETRTSEMDLVPGRYEMRARTENVTDHYNDGIHREVTVASYIRFENKQQYLGKFELEDDAALAYDEAARELFGVHARLNLPGRGEPINPPGARLAA